MTMPAFHSGTEVLIQGMTGKEGSRMASWMIRSGTNVVAGITPGKGGQTVEGRPIFNTVHDARAAFPNATTSCVVTPPAAALAAVREGMAAGIIFFHILTERIPVHDVIAMRTEAAARGAHILGPSSVGYLQFPAFRLGYLGGQHPFDTLTEGDIAVLSCSGGMTNEILMALARQDTGVRLAIAVGGDTIAGTSLTEAVQYADAHPGVRAIALFVEPGNPLPRLLINDTVNPQKPLTLCLPGDALEALPRGLPYGHTGTVLGEDQGSLADLRRMLTDAGYRTTAEFDEFIDWCKAL